MNLKKISYALFGAGLLAAYSGAHAQSQWSMTGSSRSDAKVGSASGDAAFARMMRAEYARDALANSTTNTEIAMSKAALQTADCEKIVVAADTAKKDYVVRHTAPDPTQVIKNSTCFVDVFNIKIPLKTGFGLVDNLVGQLSKMASESMCNSTNEYWSKISTAAQNGDLKSLANTAISNSAKYIPQNVYTQVVSPMQSAGYGSGQNGGSSTVQPSAGSYWNQPSIGSAQPGGAYPTPQPAVIQPSVGQPGGGGRGGQFQQENKSAVESVMNSVSNWLR